MFFYYKFINKLKKANDQKRDNFEKEIIKSLWIKNQAYEYFKIFFSPFFQTTNSGIIFSKSLIKDGWSKHFLKTF